VSEETPEPEPTGLETIEAELAGYPSHVVTTQMCASVFKVIPGAPKMPLYFTLEECAAAVQPHTIPEVLAKARELGDDPGVGQAAMAAKAIDAGDTGITIVTGVRSALSLFLGSKGPGAGADQQQKTDAALKAVALAFIITRLIGHESKERVQILKSIPAGQELLLYFAAVEIALPFTDEVKASGGTFVAELVEERSKSITNKLLRVLGKQGLADARDALTYLVSTLDDLAMYVEPNANQLALSVKSVLPAAFGSGDSLRDIVAAGADALPAYRYLVARLTLESRLALAKLALMPNIPMEDLSLVEPTPVAAPPPVSPELSAPENPFAAPIVASVPEPEPARTSPLPPSENPTLMPAEPVDAFVLPTETLPPEERLNGVYLHKSPSGELWLVFTREGVFSSEPPATSPPDWRAHIAAGHPVGTYTRDAETVKINWPGGKTTESQMVQETYALVMDGVSCDRCDFALTDQFMAGTWKRRDSEETLTLNDDGTSTAGSYALGVGAITWDGERTESLYSTLQPSSESPETLYIGGIPWDLSG